MSHTRPCVRRLSQAPSSLDIPPGSLAYKIVRLIHSHGQIMSFNLRFSIDQSDLSIPIHHSTHSEGSLGRKIGLF